MRDGHASARFRAPTAPGKRWGGSETRLRIAAFELGCAFDEGVERLLPKTAATLQAWRDLLRADKIRQYEDKVAGNLRLPALPDEWGPVDSPAAMPCAVWLHVPKRVYG